MTDLSRKKQRIRVGKNPDNVSAIRFMAIEGRDAKGVRM
jgi:hypothetical protein